MDGGYEQHRAKSRKRKIIIAGTIVGIIAIVVVAIFLIVGLSSGSVDDGTEEGEYVDFSKDDTKNNVTKKEGTVNVDKPSGDKTTVPTSTVPNTSGTSTSEGDKGKEQPNETPAAPAAAKTPSETATAEGVITHEQGPNPTQQKVHPSVVRSDKRKQDPNAGNKQKMPGNHPSVAVPPGGNQGTAAAAATAAGQQTGTVPPPSGPTTNGQGKSNLKANPVVGGQTNTQVPVQNTTVPGNVPGTPAAGGAATNASGNVTSTPAPATKPTKEAKQTPIVLGQAPVHKPEVKEQEGQDKDKSKDDKSNVGSGPVNGQENQATKTPTKVIYTRKSKYRQFVDRPKYDPNLERVFNPPRDDTDGDLDDRWMMNYESIYDIKRDDFNFEKTYGNSARKDQIKPFRCIEFNFPYNTSELVTEVSLSNTSRYFHTSIKTDTFCKITYSGYELTEEIKNKRFIGILVESIHGMEIISLIGTEENGRRSYIQFVINYNGREYGRINNNYLHFITAITRLILTGNTKFNPSQILSV